jgi:hypothetical protein
MQTIAEYWQQLLYFITSKNGKGHGIHSPFVYAFVRDVLNDDRWFYPFEELAIQQNNQYKFLLFKILHYYKPNTVIVDDQLSTQDILLYKAALPENSILYVHQHQYHQLQFNANAYDIQLLTQLPCTENAFFIVLENGSLYQQLQEYTTALPYSIFTFWQHKKGQPQQHSTKHRNHFLRYVYIHLFAVSFQCFRTEQLHNEYYSVWY